MEGAECADAETLAELVAGALPEDERAAIATHAAACARCHALLDGLLASSASSAGSGEVTRGDDDDASADVKRTFAASPGARVGRYVLAERIGAGGMGVVFAATDTELQRRVAIKLLRQSGHGAISAQGRERILREARLLASLSHPNVVTVFDVGEHEGHVFIAMELVDGGNVNDWLRRAPRTSADVIDRMIEAGRGLAAAHAGGVVHRDIKPDNILVGHDGRARLTDFGLARIDQELVSDLDATKAAALSPTLTKTGALMGTPVYMAPEQWKHGDPDPRTDQWAYCATLYELVAGTRPFAVEDPERRKAEIEAGQIRAPAEGRVVPGWLRRIIVRGLRASPSDRWPSMDVVVAELVRGRQRRTRITRALVVVGVAAIAAGSIGMVMAKREPAARPLTERERQDVAAADLTMRDTRPGCSCPYSLCEQGTCLSVCDATEFDFTRRVPVPGLAVEGAQEVLMGVSADEAEILYLGGTSCDVDRLMLARRKGTTYVPTDVTDRIDKTHALIEEGCCTLAADGTTALLATPDHQHFVRLSLATMTLDDGADFNAILPSYAKGVSLGSPVLSNDELTIYYSVYDRVVTADDSGPLEGLYESTRTSRSVPFPVGHRLPLVTRSWGPVTGESSDHLTLFVAGDYKTRVFSRAHREQKFDVVSPGSGAAVIAGWRAIPSADCQRLYTTDTPGGCRQENIAVLPAVHRPPIVPLTSP